MVPVFVGSNPITHPTKKESFVYRTKDSFFELSVPLARNVKYPLDVKRTSCLKCAFGTITREAKHLTSFCGIAAILHSGVAAASLGAAKLHKILQFR